MAIVRAVYENGVFRPTGHVSLPERCEVEFEPKVVGPAAGSLHGPTGRAELWSRFVVGLAYTALVAGEAQRLYKMRVFLRIRGHFHRLPALRRPGTLVADIAVEAERCAVGTIRHRLPALSHGLRRRVLRHGPLDCGSGFGAAAPGRQRRIILHGRLDLSARRTRLHSVRPWHDGGRALDRGGVSQTAAGSPLAPRAEKKDRP